MEQIRSSVLFVSQFILFYFFSFFRRFLHQIFARAKRQKRDLECSHDLHLIDHHRMNIPAHPNFCINKIKQNNSKPNQTKPNKNVFNHEGITSQLKINKFKLRLGHFLRLSSFTPILIPNGTISVLFYYTLLTHKCCR